MSSESLSNPKPDYSKINALREDLLMKEVFSKCKFQWTTKLAELREKRAKIKLDWVQHGLVESASARQELDLEIARAEYQLERTKMDQAYHEEKCMVFRNSSRYSILIKMLHDKGMVDILRESEEKALEAAIEYFNKYPEDQP